MRIVPTAGQVAVYFPAVKEDSRLHFHLHAPFVTELSRASIKNTPKNDPLFAQLVRLAATSLHSIKELGLLTGEFLAVLPNSHDELCGQYQQICDAIIAEMQDAPLTPTHTGSHAPAKHLLQAKTSFKNLLSEEDLRYLVQWKVTPLWVIDVPERSRQNQFLAGLEITSWDINQFVDVLARQRPDIGPEGIAKREQRRRELELMKSMSSLWRGSVSTDDIDRQLRELDGPDPTFTIWLADKSVEWHQKLYSTLHRERANPILLRYVRIIRCSDGSYNRGDGCFFPSEGSDNDPSLPRVDRGTYSSGDDEKEKAEAKKLLEELGVREVGEAELVRSILRQRYTDTSFHPDLNDLDRFVRLVEDTDTPANAGVFSNYFIFKLAVREKWGLPSAVFLDSPFLSTGLNSYHDALNWSGTNSSQRKWALSDWYSRGPVSPERLVRFAQAVGVQTKLEPKQVSCEQNPERERLRRESGERTRSPIDEDYTIEFLDDLLRWPSIELSRLIWRTMCELDQKYLTARYQKNERNGPKTADSQLVHCLRNAEWVPQTKAATRSL